MANERARQLRKSMTRQEVKLWMHLRSWRRRGFHFRRQAPRDGYILILSASPNGSLLKLMADSTILMIMHRAIVNATDISKAKDSSPAGEG